MALMSAGPLSTPHSLLERLQQSLADPLSSPPAAREVDAKRRDADWARFAEFFVPALYQAAKKICTREEDASELAHMMFVEFREGKLARYKRRPEVPFRRWLAVVLRNKWYEKQRGKKAIAAEDLEQLGAAADPLDEVIDREFASHAARIALETMLRRFPNGAVYADHLRGEKTLPQIAQTLGKSMAAVYKEKSLMLRQLRQDLAGLVD